MLSGASTFSSYVIVALIWLGAGWSLAWAVRWLDPRVETLLEDGLAAALTADVPQVPPIPYYPLLEIGAALLLGTVALAAGTPLRAGVGMAFCAALLLCAWIDWRNGIIPDVVVLPLLVGGICLSGGWRPFVDGVDSTAGAFLGGGMAMLTRRLGRAYGGCLGMGDVKLLAAVGAWLGPCAVAVVFPVAALGIGIFMMLFRWRSIAGAWRFGPVVAGVAIAYLLAITINGTDQSMVLLLSHVDN